VVWARENGYPTTHDALDIVETTRQFSNREQGIGNREQGIGNREQGIGNREQGIGNRELIVPNDQCPPIPMFRYSTIRGLRHN
jgi:hypothetical protein